MLKKTITYEDYNGVERTETFYFNLTKAELTKMEVGTTGGLADKIKRIVDAKDAAEIMAVFDDIIRRAYGIKSDDGKRLIKSDEISEAFTQTPAYDSLFMEIISDEKAAADFINQIIPKVDGQKSPEPVSKFANSVPANN